MRHSPEVARYEQIALDIAGRIVRKEYKEGDKLFGRSTLAGKYNVSPETVRRAVALLQTTGIVDPQPGRGIIICSRQAAEVFLREFESRRVLEDLQERISNLLVERRKLDQILEEELNQLVNFTFKSNSRLQQIEEIEVPDDSELVGKSLESLRFRTITGATVLALERGGEEIFSPDSGIPIEAGDLLVFVGTPEAKERVRKLFGEKSTKKDV
ncbi:MAG: TrkA C-terminal domain-containing protein [Bacillota bacterium]|jgi:K+/H+ antiporter YhaU regulatory subunit KhtT